MQTTGFVAARLQGNLVAHPAVFVDVLHRARLTHAWLGINGSRSYLLICVSSKVQHLLLGELVSSRIVISPTCVSIAMQAPDRFGGEVSKTRTGTKADPPQHTLKLHAHRSGTFVTTGM